MKDVPPPAPTGRVLEDPDICGSVFMWDNGNAVLVVVPGLEGACLPLFSSKAKLEVAAHKLGLTYERIKHVTDPDGFVESVHSAGVRIILDPYETERGTMRYCEIRVKG